MAVTAASAVAALRNLFWEISLGPPVHRSFAHSLVRALVLFAPASGSSPADAAVGGGIRRATDISRPSISHSLHNACGRCSDDDDTGCRSLESPLRAYLRPFSRGVGRNPVSRVTVGFQPREESRDAFVCRRRPILPAVSMAD